MKLNVNRCKLAFRLAVTAGLPLLMAGSALAESVVYSKTRTTINAGVLALRSQSGWLRNPNPFVFYILDQRADIKPAGWTFDNPLAPSIAGPRESARWGASLPEGTKVRRDMAPYWEVDLESASDEKLSAYDVLLVNVNGNISLTNANREKLRRFVDGGGLLWIDYATGMNFSDNNGFFVPLSFEAGRAGQRVIRPSHPLMWSPYLILPSEAVTLGAETAAVTPSELQAHGMWIPILADSSGKTTLVTATYGAGRIVVTSTNVSASINQPVGFGSNGLVSGRQFLGASLGEVKLAFNMIRWANVHQTAFKSTRRTNSNFESLGAPLGEKWTAGFGASQPVAIYNGMVFVVQGNRLAAFDALPNRDLDGDGDPDDGARKGRSAGSGAPIGDPIIDPLTNGLNASDLVWSVTLPEQGSAPTVADIMVPGDPRGARPLVLITGSNGSLFAYAPFPVTGNGLLNNTSPIVSNLPAPDWLTTGNSGGIDGGPPSPAYHEGIIYVTAPGGVYLVRAVGGSGGATLEHMTSGGPVWAFPPSPATGNPIGFFPSPNTPATVGYIPVYSTTGGSDRVLYFGTAPVTVGVAQNAGLRTLWLGVKGEKLEFVNADSSTFTRTYRTRAAANNLRVYPATIAQDPRLGYVLRDGTGRVISSAQLSPTAPGHFVVNFSEVAEDPSDGFRRNVYADYTIDWAPAPAAGQPSGLGGIVRTSLGVPEPLGSAGQFQPQQRVMGAIGLGQNGLSYMITQGDPNPGSLWVIRETSGGQSQVVYRWQLPGTPDGTYQHQLAGSTEIVTVTGIPAVSPFNGTGDPQPIRGLKFAPFPPVERNGTIYALATGFWGSWPVTLLMAFDANPPAFEIRLDGQVTGATNSVVIRQPDLQKATNLAIPDTRNSYTFMTEGQYQLDRQNGIIRIRNFNRSSNNIDGAISVSMPVGIQYGAGGERLYYPDDNGTWNPMRYFTMIPFFAPGAPPMVSGDTLYLAGTQAAPNLQVRTLVYAWDADVPPNDTHIVPVKTSNSIGYRQMVFFRGNPRNPAAPAQVNPHLRWPALERDQPSFGEFLERLNRYGLPGTVKGLVGSEGLLALSTDQALRLFERVETVVADSGRIIEIDSEGFPSLTMDATRVGQPFFKPEGNEVVPPLVKTNKLVQPTKVYRASPTEFLIVDGGANRVVRANRSGFEARSISEFTVDTKHIPAGYRPGDPTELRRPTDVIFWTDYVPRAQNPFSVAADYEFWVHYLIADAGNNRLVEVVDRYQADPNSRAVFDPVRDNDGKDQVGQLFWHSPANELGKTFSYTAVQRVISGSYEENGQEYPVYTYVMAFGNIQPERRSMSLDVPDATAPREASTGGGGLLVQGGGYNLVVKGMRLRVGTGERVIPIRDPNSLEVRRSITDGEFEVLVATADGVFILRMPTDRNNTNDIWEAKWALLNEDYSRGLRSWVRATPEGAATAAFTRRFLVEGGVPLRASSARWMPNGDVLITNSWSGKVSLLPTPNEQNQLVNPADPQYDFFGEVFVLDHRLYSAGASNNGWNNPIDAPANGTSPFKLAVPPLSGTAPLRQPVFADRPF